MKKIIALFLVVAMMVPMTACGGSDTPSVDNSSEPTIIDTPQPDNNNESEEYSESMLFVGYNIYYPESVGEPSRTDYGYGFGTNNCIVYFEAPGYGGGEMYEAQSLDDAFEFSKAYIYKTLESKKHRLFDPDRTELMVATTENKTINDIEMLRVTGKLKNTLLNTEYDFAGYFFTSGSKNRPAYIWGIELPDATADVVSVVDETASHITKN